MWEKKSSANEWEQEAQKTLCNKESWSGPFYVCFISVMLVSDGGPAFLVVSNFHLSS